MNKVDYVELLKSPKWQKKRLQIMRRDKWRCVQCGWDEDQLHVHHKYYLKDKKPWEYPNDALITLCEGCHRWKKEKYE